MSNLNHLLFGDPSFLLSYASPWRSAATLWRKPYWISKDGGKRNRKSSGQTQRRWPGNARRRAPVRFCLLNIFLLYSFIHSFFLLLFSCLVFFSYSFFNLKSKLDKWIDELFDTRRLMGEKRKEKERKEGYMPYKRLEGGGGYCVTCLFIFSPQCVFCKLHFSVSRTMLRWKPDWFGAAPHFERAGKHSFVVLQQILKAIFFIIIDFYCKQMHIELGVLSKVRKMHYSRQSKQKSM